MYYEYGADEDEVDEDNSEELDKPFEPPLSIAIVVVVAVERSPSDNRAWNARTTDRPNSSEKILI